MIYGQRQKSLTGGWKASLFFTIRKLLFFRTGSIFYGILLLLIFAYDTSHGQIPTTDDFESYVGESFQRIKNIYFTGNDTLLIGEVSTIDVGYDGRLVITDWIGNEAILFGIDGNYITHLYAQQCNPEVHFRPTGAKIKPDSEILVMGTSPWGFLFNKDGRCKSAMSTDFSAPDNNAIVVGGVDKMIGIYSGGTGQVLRFMDGIGRTIQEVNLPKSPAPGVDYRWDGGGLVKTSKFFYYATPSSPLTQLNLQGHLMQIFEYENSWFRPITQDVSDPFDRNIQSLREHLSRVVRNKSMVDNVSLLDHDLVMIQYHNQARRFGLQVFDETGNLITEILGTPDIFHHAHAGLAYRVVQPDVDQSGNLPNPYIEVYEYRGK